VAEIPQGWESRGREPTLFRRFRFDGYSQTRDFLDALAAITETHGVHPQNINFGSNYINITLDPDTAGQADTSLALRISALYSPAES
jgi:pterin-4a-carbinolamine dehydratase